MLQQDMNIDLLLLDINMPKIDGFGVLERLNQFRWIEELPVIMISATEDRAVIERCYSLGITDYIRHPFDSFIVQRRVKNTLTLYANQKRLMGMVSDQIYQNEKDSHVMIGILSHIVEFRNSESAQHVLQVQTVTEMLLRKLTEKTDVYGLTEDKIRLITTASALHDIGKISIPENILNKAGALTPEEFNIIRTHPSSAHPCSRVDAVPRRAAGQGRHRDLPLAPRALDGGGYRTACSVNDPDLGAGSRTGGRI
ncbi:MAG: two-component system response regulator [Butyricicoccus sp.]